MKHRTIANLSHCKAEEVEAIRLALRHKADLARIVSAAGEGGLELVQGPSVGAVWLLSQLARDLGTVAALGSDRRAKVGDPLLHETEVGPLILPREADRVSAWTDEAVLAGAKVIGGGRLNSTTLAPSIIVNPPADAKVSTHEVFGPITCVYPFTRLNEAVAAANSLPVAFQASIFTEDLRTAFDVAERLAASAAMVNDHTAFRTDWMPFVGRRASGYGIGGIPWTMREMSEQKMIVFRT